jgi:hypothetical protein
VPVVKLNDSNSGVWIEYAILHRRDTTRLQQ